MLAVVCVCLGVIGVASAAADTTVSGSVLYPTAVAVDQAGDVFVAGAKYIGNTSVTVVTEEIPDGNGGYQEQIVDQNGLGDSVPSLAVDSAGDVYIADFRNSRVIEDSPQSACAPGSCVYPATPTQTVVESGARPNAIALDGGGDVFIAIASSHSVREVRPLGACTPGGCAYGPDSDQITIEGSGEYQPGGVAVDGQGDVFMGNASGQGVFEYSPTIAACAPQDCTYGGPNMIDGSLSYTGQLATDAAGDVFVTDRQNGRVIEEVVAAGGGFSNRVVASGLNYASDATPFGDSIYIAVSNKVVKHLLPPASVHVAVEPQADGTYTVTATAQNQDGSTATGYQDASPSWSDADGDLGAQAPAPFVNGISQRTGVTLPAAKAETISVTTDGVTGTSSAFDVTGPASQFVVTTDGPYLTGQAFTVKVTAEDAVGHVVTTYGGSPTWSDSSSQLTGGPAAFVNGVSRNKVTLGNPVKSDTIQVADGSITGSSAAILVQGQVASFILATTGPYVAGQAFTVKLTAKDSLGDTVTRYAGTPDLSDATGRLSGTAASFVRGISTSSVMVSGSVTGDTITATDGSATGTSPAFTVTDAPVRFVVATTGPYAAGHPFTVNITAVNSAGKAVTGYRGTPSWSDSSGQLTAGPATFSNGVSRNKVTLPAPAKGDSITVSGGGITGSSAALAVLGPVTQFVITTAGPYAAGQAFTVAVRAEDSLGQVVTNYQGSPTWTDSSGQLTGNPASFASGVSRNKVTLPNAAKGDTITATDGSFTGTSAKFTVKAAS